MRIVSLMAVFALIPTLVVAQDLEEQINARFQTVKTASYPASTFVKPMAWSVGQWVEVGITDDDKEKSIVRQAIVARDGEWWTLEMKSMTEDDITIMQMEVKGMNKVMSGGSYDDIEFRKIRMKTNDDEPITIDGFVLDMAKGMYKDAMKNWAITGSDIKPGPAITVPAGTFSSTSVIHTEIQVLGHEVESTCWISSSVPISGIVKTTDDDGNTQVLLDFGLDGAQASF